MIALAWAALTLAAIAWPAVVSGPLDGAPLDHPLEAIVLGVLVPWLLIAAPRVLNRRDVRAIVVALLAWKAMSGLLFVRDGWCLRFTSPVAVFLDDVRVPHSWDVRADWRSDVPQCSAIMTMNYGELERFPVWFYNLPPANFRDPVRPENRPPGATLRMDLGGYLHTSQQGRLQMLAGEDMALSASVDGLELTQDQLRRGIAISGGDHDVQVRGDLRRSHWSLDLRLNDAPMWQSALATTTRAGAVDVWLRPVARYVPAALVLAILAVGVSVVISEARTWLLTGVVTSVGVALVASLGREGLTRLLPLVLMIPAGVAAWRRQRSHLVHALVIGLPFLSIFMALGWPRAGLFSWFSSGDDWWMFQRFAYRIYMQGHWIQAGENAFYNQPLYRWIAGALHLLFGDSSVGELFWDAAAALTGAVFAFHVVKTVAAAQWAWVASVMTLMLFVFGPTWYLIGRGMSEFSSAGFLYGAVLLALRAQDGSTGFILLSGICATLAFYARLNNLPMVLAVMAFAWPLSQPVRDLGSPRRLREHVSYRVLIGVAIVMAIGLVLFAARTWYYTGVFSLLYGTQAAARSVWQTTTDNGTPMQNVIGSFLMVLTMSDPPRLDPRSIPIVLGLLAAVLAIARIRPFDRLPLNAVLLCLAAFVGSLVARGSAYPGRFSVHVIPVTVTLFVSAIALMAAGKEHARS